MSRFIVSVVVAFVAATAGVFAVPGAAHADPPYTVGCYQYSCDGQNPYWTNCGLDKQLIYDVRAGGDAVSSRVRLYYSPRCASAWGETTMVSRTIYVHSYHLNWAYRTTYSQYTNESYRYSPMVYDGGLLAKACVSAIMGGAGTCTSYY